MIVVKTSQTSQPTPRAISAMAASWMTSLPRCLMVSSYALTPVRPARIP